jgi:hypothetical protein
MELELFGEGVFLTAAVKRRFVGWTCHFRLDTYLMCQTSFEVELTER